MVNKSSRGVLFLAFIMITVFLPVSAFATAGDLDTSFFPPVGYSITSTDYPAGSMSSSLTDMWKMAVLSDGKYISGSAQNTVNGNLILQKHMADGSPDAGFGNGGTATYTFSGSNGGAKLTSIVVQPDSKILAGGTIHNENVSAYSQFVVRFNNDGSVDSGFGTGGIIITKLGMFSDLNSIAVQSDGKIIAVGDFQDGTGHGSLTINRYNSNGTPDSSFGTSGRATYQNAQYMQTLGGKVIVKNDGKVLVLGSAVKLVASNLVNYYLLLQFNTNGTLDTTFGTGGVITESDAINDVGITPDGKIITLGDNATTYHPAGCSWITQRAITLRRFLTNGATDSSFGTDGILTYADPNSHMLGYSMVIQPDGKIVAEVSATTADSLCGEHSTIHAIARLNADGSLDSTFKNGGIVVPGGIIPGFPSASVSSPIGIFLQDDGRITAMYRGNDNTMTGVTNKLVTLRLMGDSVIMALPTTQQTFDFYEGIENPILTSIPADLRPIGVGRIAADGINGYNIADITVSLPRFTANVDVYVLIYAPAYSPNILFLDQAGIWDSTATTTVPYFNNQAPSDALTNLSILQGIQILPGEYYAGILVTPSGQATMGNLSEESLQITGPYYLWVTHWTVSPPSGQ